MPFRFLFHDFWNIYAMCYSISDQQIDPQIGNSSHPRPRCPRPPCCPQPSWWGLPFLLRPGINRKHHFWGGWTIYFQFPHADKNDGDMKYLMMCAPKAPPSPAPPQWLRSQKDGQGHWKPLTTIITYHLCWCVTLTMASNLWPLVHIGTAAINHFHAFIHQ